MQSRPPVSPVLTETHVAVLGALIGCHEPVTCAALAERAELTVGQTRRALGDLRELRCASLDRVAGVNVWTAV